MQSMISHAIEVMLDGNSTKLTNVVEECQKLGWNNVTIFEEILKPALYQVGVKWEVDEITVADEHLATMTVDYVLSYLKQDKMAPKRNKTAMLFCVEGEEHYLGLKMTASVISSYGFDVKFLGPNLPTKYAVHFARKWKPDLVGISISMRSLVDKLEDCVKSIHSLPHNPTIFIGGRLIDLHEPINVPPHVEKVSSLYDLRYLLKENSVDSPFSKEVSNT